MAFWAAGCRVILVGRKRGALWGVKSVQLRDEVTDVTKKLIAAVLLAGLMPAAVAAEESRSGRYTMHKSDDGFVRLDTLTGTMSLCRKGANGWGCEPLGDAAPSSPDELARLRRENTELKAEIRRMEEHLGLSGERRAKNRGEFKLPTEQEVEQALDYFERMLKKFQDRLKRLERKSDTPERQL